MIPDTDPEGTAVRLPADFLTWLEAAAARREVLELQDPHNTTKGTRLGALPLFRIPRGENPILYGVATPAAQVDRFLIVSHRKAAGISSWALELVSGAWTWGNLGPDPTPVLAPSPDPARARLQPLIRLELLAWSARLGVDVRITYESGSKSSARHLADVRIIPDGPIRATDLAIEEPRSFLPDRIREFTAAPLTWEAATGFLVSSGAHTATRSPRP